MLEASIHGLAVGAIYGLIALGFVLIYKSSSVLNLAQGEILMVCLLYTSPSPRDLSTSRMPSSA